MILEPLEVMCVLPHVLFYYAEDVVQCYIAANSQTSANVSEMVQDRYIQCESKKYPPYGFLNFFPKRLGIFNQFFIHLLYDHFYTRVQIFIKISPTLTKLCHILSATTQRIFTFH